MPLYEFECESCSRRFERIQKFSDPLPSACPECGGPVRKLLSSPAIQFKGSGWYITDYARKDGGKSGTAGKDATGSKDGSAADSTGAGDAGKSSSSSDASSSVSRASAPETPPKSS